MALFFHCKVVPLIIFYRFIKYRIGCVFCINNETLAIDRKAHMFWEFPEVEKQVSKFIESISMSGEARQKILMTGDTKDAKSF